jgi:hypothetical protein
MRIEGKVRNDNMPDDDALVRLMESTQEKRKEGKLNAVIVCP